MRAFITGTMAVAVVAGVALAADAPDAGVAARDKGALSAVVKSTISAATRVRDGGVDVSALPFTPATIQQVVKSYEPQIRQCYEAYLATLDKGVSGSVLTGFFITAQGTVRSPLVSKKRSTLKDPALHECIAAVLSTMEFPPPPDGAEQPVEFPFNLQPRE